MLELDHIVVAADRLEDGIEWFRERTGVVVPLGGRHAKMGTHNAVGRFSSDDDTYVEIIALDLEAAPPPADVVRWFSLDDPAFLQSLKADGPRLAHWVLRTDDITGTVAQNPEALGVPMAMSRGDLHWTIAVRPDGRLAEGGLIPTVIQWPEGPHPSRRMTDLGLRLELLTLHHREPETLRTILAGFGADELALIMQTTGSPWMSARLGGAGGAIELAA